MADFQQAVALTLQHEGGYVNDPADPGGATNMGITQRDLPDTPIQNLTVAQAVAYYSNTYWKGLYSSLTSQQLANKLFDWGVLFGVGTAVKVLQGVLGIKQDGLFGPASLAAVNATDGVMLLEEYKNSMLIHASRVVAANPTLTKFLAGWVRRINS